MNLCSTPPISPLTVELSGVYCEHICIIGENVTIGPHFVHNLLNDNHWNQECVVLVGDGGGNLQLLMHKVTGEGSAVSGQLRECQSQTGFAPRMWARQWQSGWNVALA